MTFGIQVISAGGYTQIDDTYGNFRIIASGSVNLSALNPSAEVSFPAQSVIPLVFVRAPYGTQFWGATGVQTVRSNGFTISTFVGGLVKYIVCAPITGAGSDTFGLRITGPSGQTTFDAAHNLIMLDHYVQQAMDNFHNGNITLSVPAPPVGERYILLNPLTIHSQIVTNFEYMTGSEYYLTAWLNSETSITYKSEDLGFEVYQTWSTNGSRTLLSGYVNI